MTREELKKMRKIYDELLKSKQDDKLKILDESNESTEIKMTSIHTLQLEELINFNHAILEELRYMNDKDHEVNNG